MKICTRCNEQKGYEEFYSEKRATDGLSSACRLCIRAQQKTYRAQNADKIAAGKKEYVEANREQVQERIAEWQRKNPDKYREYVRTSNHARRGKGTIKRAEWLALLEQCDHRCLGCGVQGNLELDHIIPLSKGGTNTIDNAQPLCRTCNARKATQTIDYRVKSNG